MAAAIERSPTLSPTDEIPLPPFCEMTISLLGEMVGNNTHADEATAHLHRMQ